MRISISILLILTLLSFSAYAQTSKTDSSNADAKSVENSKQETLNLRIIQVLKQTADEAKGWEDVGVSSKVQAQIADLLWDFEPLVAEIYLKRAWDKAKQAKEDEKKPSQFRNYSNRVAVSREVLSVARKRNPELAEKWLNELAKLAEEDFADKNKGLFDDRTARSAVLLQMAMQTVETDVQAAASLANESLRDGISFGFQSVLIQIQQKNPELAAQVFRTALQRINSVGITDTEEIQILYSYLYTPGVVSTTAGSNSQGQTTISIGRNRSRITSAAQLYPELAQEFLVSAARAILRLPFLVGEENPELSARKQFGIVNTILSRLGNSSPELSQGLQERLASISANANFSPDSQTSPREITPIEQGETISDYKKRLLDEILEQAEKISNSLERDIFIAQGVLRSDAEEFEKAKNIAEKIEDKELREEISNFLIYRTSLDFIQKDKFDEADKLLQKNSNQIQKAAILVVGGQKFVVNKDFTQAQYWLYQAEKLFKKNKSSDEDWINIGFGITTAYAKVDDFEAIRMLGESGKLINKDAEKYNSNNAPLAIGFSGLTYSNFTHGTNGFSLDSAVNSFPKEKIEDVLEATNSISNPKAKGLAVVTISRKNLKKVNPNTKQNPNSKSEKEIQK